MEEKRPDQHIQAEPGPAQQDVTLRASPRPHASAAQGKERELIAQARARADEDVDAMRNEGHGDHKGEGGF